MRAYLLACVLALSTTACLEEDTAATDAAPETVATDPAGAGPNEPSFQVAQAPAGPPTVAGSIDWEAARADRAKASTNTSNVQVQNVTGAQAAPPPVPMLLPSGIVQAQNARPPAVVTTEDGYFATYQLPKYDAIVNGTATATVTGGQPSDKATMNFEIGEGSAQLTFSRYGADYLIEFECRQIDGGESCVTENEAKEFADSLFVAQTQ